MSARPRPIRLRFGPRYITCFRHGKLGLARNNLLYLLSHKFTASCADQSNIFPPPTSTCSSYVPHTSSMIPLRIFTSHIFLLASLFFFFFLLVSFVLRSTLGGSKCKSLLFPAGYRDAYANDVSNHLCGLLLPAVIRIHYATKFHDFIYERYEIKCCAWHWV